jgi:protein SCO1
MRSFNKGLVLFFSLLLPILLFLFLKYFGNNKYEIQKYNFECEIKLEDIDNLNNTLSLNEIKVLDIRIDDNSKLIDNYINKVFLNKKIKIITLSEQDRNLNWIDLLISKSTLDKLLKCYSANSLKSFVLLLDKKNTLRGIYNIELQSEIERLNVEIDILKLENE